MKAVQPKIFIWPMLTAVLCSCSNHSSNNNTIKNVSNQYLNQAKASQIDHNESFNALRTSWNSNIKKIKTERKPKGQSNAFIWGIHCHAMDLTWDEVKPSIIYSTRKSLLESNSSYHQLEELNKHFVWKMIREAIISKNPDDLVKIISSKCPIKAYTFPIESMLTEYNPDYIIKAYLKCSIKSNKSVILSRIIESFKGNVNFGEENPDDFVRKCETWYNNNKRNIYVNRDYSYKYATAPLSIPERLFKMK